MLKALPHELIEQILLKLDPKDIRNCKLISSQFNDFICSSIVLQYLLACQVAGVIDNPHSNLSYADRYDRLLKREKAWSSLQPVFTTTFDATNEPSSIYDLTAGTFLLGDVNYRDLHYCTLPSTPDDIPQWITLNAHGPNRDWSGNIIDMGMAVYEHDLIVNVVSSPINIHASRIEYTLDMILIKFSTGEYHPLARRPRIHVQDSYGPRPAIALDVVGDTLALAVNNLRGMSRDRLFIFDWKTGHTRLQHEATENAYASLTFISPKILLVPNVVLGHYEVWKIPTETDDVPHQILSLCFPALSRGHFILNLVCRGEPNPYLHTLAYAPSRPFHASPDASIIITIIRLASFPGLLGAAYTLIIHRQSLLTTISNLTTHPSFLTLPLNTNHHHFHHLNRSIITTPETEMRYSLSSFFSSDSHELFSTSSSSSDSSSLGGTYGVYSIPWSEWGPPISRWFDDDQTQTRWITVSAGQRWAVLDPSEEDNGMKSRIRIIDFNPYNIHRACVVVDHDGLAGEMVIERKGDYLGRGHAFAEDIEMGLGCTIYTAPELYDFDGLLMEEERLLGLKINEGGNVEKITIFHFG
ncbi:hypothetical protein F5887DRAFT_969911 [Amanita rubescens]|nr:hypothetical protein F5887DRAFT_969911 [Amanita rubescens]